MTQYTEYISDCIVFLGRIGVNVEESDAFLRYCIEKSIFRILNLTNIPDTVPPSLKYVLSSMACGYFLKDQYTSGKLSSVFSFEKAVKSWSMGDTSYTYRDTISPEENFTAFLDKMIDGHMDEIIKFRRIKW